jgi:hypothetical protein
MTTNPEKFRLNILGADEDVPRLLLAYGRGCGGEVAFVMRPRDNTALLVHQVKKEPAKVWRTDLGLAPSRAPELDADPAAAVTELKKLKAGAPPAGPATLKGKWAGTLFCDDGTPRMVLERKVAAYGTLKLASKPDGRWTAMFDRAGKWFSQAKQESVERSGLAEAIQAGMGLVIGLVSEACSFRDTRRRNTVDADYAAQHPYTPPREPRDVTDRYAGRSTFRAVEQGDGWVVVNDVGSVVAKFGTREKGKAEKHASALTRGKAPVATVAPDIASGFGLSGMPGVVVAPALSEIAAPEPPACPTSVARIASATEGGCGARGAVAVSARPCREAPAARRGAGEVAALFREGAEDGVGGPTAGGRCLRAGSRRHRARGEARHRHHAAEDLRARVARGSARGEIVLGGAAEDRAGAAHQRCDRRRHLGA